MSTENELEPAQVVSAPNLDQALDGGEGYSVEQALESLSKRNQPAESAEAAEPATAETESAVEADAAPEGTTAEDKESEPETPAIDPPKSWSKEAHERWSKLDRETQEYLAARESEDQKAIKRSLNEAAEVRKAAEAERKAVAEERERYLKAATSDVESKEADIANRFPHIKSQSDVNFLANEAVRLANTGNPDDMVQSQQVQAYLQAWRTAQDDLAVTKATKVEVERKHSEEKQSKWTEFVQNESKAFSETLSSDDKAKLKGWLDEAPGFLEAKGFSKEELVSLASGKERLAIHDRRVQSLILDGLKYRDLQKAPAKALPKAVPAVQKPGVAPAKGAVAAENVQALRTKLSGSGSVEDALALYQAKKSRASR